MKHASLLGHGGLAATSDEGCNLGGELIENKVNGSSHRVDVLPAFVTHDDNFMVI